MTIIAINSENTMLAGALVYWRLSGEANGDDLNNALIEAGMEEHLVNLPTPQRALRRTLNEYVGGDVFLRAGKRGDRGTYLVRQGQTDEGPEFFVWLEATLGPGGIPEFEVWQHPATSEPMSWSVDVDALTNRFWHHVYHVTTTDISAWLIAQTAECDALSLRDSGGVYFIPRDTIDLWRKRVECLHEQTLCRVHMVPAMHSDDAVDAVMAALVEECTTFTENLSKDIGGGALGQRALENRGEQAKDLLAKLTRYEKLLGTSLGDIREQVVEQRTNAVQAALATSAEDGA